MNSFPDSEIVICFENFLPAVTERAIVVEDARATGLEKFLVLVQNAAHHARQTEGVAGSLPRFAVDADACLGHVIIIMSVKFHASLWPGCRRWSKWTAPMARSADSRTGVGKSATRTHSALQNLAITPLPDRPCQTAMPLYYFREFPGSGLPSRDHRQ
jgi:hypothetical protein